MPALDVGFCRGFFPNLDDDWAFLENAGGTLVPRPVIDRVTDYMTRCQVQPGAGYAASVDATARMDAGRRFLADLINADADEIVVGPNTTANVYVLSHAIRPWFEDGDEIVVTNQDHEANSGAWRRWEATGITVKEWKVDPGTGELDPADLDGLLTGRTRLVCFTWCSNIVGSLHDAASIVARIHAAGALACVDAVAYAPHRRVDVKAADVDFLVCSPYKIFGPQMGLLYGRRELLARTVNQNHDFVDGQPAWMLCPGGPNHELTGTVSGTMEYFDAVHAHHFHDNAADARIRIGRVFDLFADHEAILAGRLAGFLADRARIHLFGRQDGARDGRVPVFSFTVEGEDSRSVAAAAHAEGLAVGVGHFFAARCIDAIGAASQNGVVRASMVHYNTVDEVDRLIRHLDARL